MAKTNIDYLRENLTDEQSEWLDAIISEHHRECHNMELTISDHVNSYDELSNRLDEAENRQLGTSIDTGIGVIRYETDGSLDLQFLMEGLADAIKDHGVKDVLDGLRNTYAV